ncbi:hypothetical protein KA005_00045, partial [bacterium]|nr:hypothetical protein [bacterium]
MVSPFLFLVFFYFPSLIFGYVNIPRIIIREALVSRDGTIMQDVRKINIAFSTAFFLMKQAPSVF